MSVCVFAGRMGSVCGKTENCSADRCGRAVRMLFANACDCEPDKQGRILLPQMLREHIEAKKELVIIGVGRRAEIWTKEGWDEYNAVTYKDYEQTLAKLAELGI